MSRRKFLERVKGAGIFEVQRSGHAGGSARVKNWYQYSGLTPLLTTTQAQPRRASKREPRSGTEAAPRRWLERTVSLPRDANHDAILAPLLPPQIS